MDDGKELLQFESTGYLRPGIYDCSVEGLKTLTFTNSHRRDLGEKLLHFLRWPRQSKAFANAYIGGGFVSNRPFPVDVDLVLETLDPYGPGAFAAIEPFFSQGLDRLWEKYSVHLHFWMENAPRSLVDYKSFFQYVRPVAKDIFALQRKGILRLSLQEASLNNPVGSPETDKSAIRSSDVPSPKVFGGNSAHVDANDRLSNKL